MTYLYVNLIRGIKVLISDRIDKRREYQTTTGNTVKFTARSLRMAA